MRNLVEEEYYDIEVCEKTGQVVSLVWKETTANMTDIDFKSALSDFASKAIEHKTPFLMVDSLKWKHQFEDVQETMTWRAQSIIPRYMRAGVKKEAFLIPAGEPKIQVHHESMMTDSFSSKEEIEKWFFD